MTIASRRAREAMLPLGGFGLAAGLFLLVLLVWAAMAAGSLAQADAAILRALHAGVGAPSNRGWLARLLPDVTVLGGGRMLTLLVLGAAGLFVVRRQAGGALLLVGSAYAGSALVGLLKHLVGRTRPDILPRLVVETSASFPSAHAANSAIVFLTLAALATRLEAHRATRLYTMAVAIVLTLLIGVSRLYLGVHWPSDVLGGWGFGAGWAALTLAIGEYVLPRERRGPSARV